VPRSKRLDFVFQEFRGKEGEVQKGWDDWRRFLDREDEVEADKM